MGGPIRGIRAALFFSPFFFWAGFPALFFAGLFLPDFLPKFFSTYSGARVSYSLLLVTG